MLVRKLSLDLMVMVMWDSFWLAKLCGYILVGIFLLEIFVEIFWLANLRGDIYHLVGSELQSSGQYGKKAKTKENHFVWAKFNILMFLSTIISVKQKFRMFLLWMIELAEDESGKVIQPRIIQHGCSHHGLVRSMMMTEDEDHVDDDDDDDDDVTLSIIDDNEYGCGF